jgi:2-keto-4-pentenoate hydratase/2-oxohepta-3-ene-1,7-dioic acid hydratase in catechol pathway
MARWVRFRSAAGSVGFGTLEGETVAEYSGDQFGNQQPTGFRLGLAGVSLLAPCAPSKLIALWNNFHALAAKLGKPAPAHPLYLIKPSSCVIGHRHTIERPLGYAGKIAFEGELGIVIGRRCHNVSVEEAARHIFGYTCINDVTAISVMNEYPDFVQWCRSKGYDTFGAIGPFIATELDWQSASVVTLLDGVERQRYALSDMILPPAEVVSRLSHDMSLLPGDVIACGTSLGVGSIPDGSTVEVTIDGLGTLSNTLGVPTASPATPT